MIGGDASAGEPVSKDCLSSAGLPSARQLSCALEVSRLYDHILTVVLPLSCLIVMSHSAEEESSYSAKQDSLLEG
jgi:hypothetical protein